MPVARSRLPLVGVIALAFAGAALTTPSIAAGSPSYPGSHPVLRSGTATHAPAARPDDTEWPQATGERLLGTPTTQPCVQTIVKDYPFKNTAYGPDKNFHGRYRPPADCPGPWSRVVATISVHVTGVQFDRVGDLRLGDVDVWAYSTSEPRGDGAGVVTWTMSKDITDYTDLLLQRQRLSFEIGNVITGPYNGVYYGTLKLTFYPTDDANRVPKTVPDRVLPVIREADISSDTPTASGTVTVPDDATTLTADLLVQGHGGCDEFWWADAPPPFPGQCGGAPYRETELFVDGTLAGIVSPYPYLFTGAAGPRWWEPLPAPQAWNLRPWRLDLTPFVGLLADGKPHTVSLEMLDWDAQSGNFFRINLALLADTSGLGPTTGSLTSARATKHARVLQHVTADHYQMTGQHEFTAVGWYQVPGGPRVTTTVQQTIDATSHQSRVNGVFDYYDVEQLVRAKSTPIGGGGSRLVVTSDSHPATLNSISNGWVVHDDTDAVQTRAGVVVSASHRRDLMRSLLTSGSYQSSERWRYADTSGACGTTTLAGADGVITKDVQTDRCVWTPLSGSSVTG